jgi:iron complex outermembrane receptor protein
MRTILKITTSLAVLAVAQSVSPAFAADVEATAVANSDAGAESASAESDSSGLSTIVVTATKRETDLQDTPIAISVVDQQIIADRHVQSLIDLADGAIPSLRVATFEARQSALTVGIRGIVPFDANQTARDQGVGIYLDGVYLGRQQGLNAALFDVARVEVLRGPQGTLFGRNTEGGAVSIVTKEPTGEFGGRVESGVGNYGSYNGEAHVDLPSIAGISFKVDGVMQHQDATVTNPLAGQYGWNYYNRVGGRISAKWEPFAGFKALFSYDKSKDENTPFYSQLLNYNPNNRPVATLSNGVLTCSAVSGGCINPLSPLVQVEGQDRMKTADIGVPQQLSVDRTHGFDANLSYDFTKDIQLRSITAWRGVDTEQWDNSGGAHRTVFAPNANFSRYSLSNLSQDQFSQEFQIVGSIAHLDWVVGLYHFDEHAQEEAATPSSNKWNANGTGYTINSETVFGPITSSNQGWDPASWFKQRGSYADARSNAAFGQFTWSPIDPLHITVGGRYTHDTRDGVLYVVQNKPTNFHFHLDEDRFDPMATVAFEITPDINVYAKYATGYRAGGANDRSQTFTAFGSEEVKSYEIGSKMDLLDHRLRLNLAGYIMDRTGTQIDFDNVDIDPTSPTFGLHTEETRNAPGTSKIRGVEVEVTGKPMDGLTLGASYAYTYTHIPATPNPLPGMNNALFQVFTVFTPENAASGYIDYELPVSSNDTKLRFHIDGNYADPTYSFQAENVKTESSFIVNGSIALTDIPMTTGTHATLSVWARNLFDEAHVYRRSNANNATLGSYGNFNPPRTFGVEGTINF